MIPFYFVELESLPLTINGKVNRKALPEPEIVAGADYIAPRNEIEERLVEIWSEVLDIEKDKISVRANFFELGGHSLKATILVSKIRRYYEREIKLFQLFKYDTIEMFSSLLSEGNSTLNEVQCSEKKEYYSTTEMQKNMYLLQAVNKDNISYNLYRCFKIIGKFNIEKAKNTLQKIIQKNSILRASFKVINGSVKQKEISDKTIEIKTVQLLDSDISDKMSELNVPFKLNDEFLIRPFILSKNQDENYLFIIMHHMICDGISFELIIKEFISIYSKGDIILKKYDFNDFIQFDKQEKEILKKESAKLFWADLFSDGVKNINIPLDFDRANSFNNIGNYIQFELSHEVYSGVKSILSKHGITLYMFVLSVLNILLYKYSGSKTIIVGTPMSDRVRDEFDKIVGLFIDSIIMKNNICDQESYGEYLKRIKLRTIETFDNRDFQYSDLIKLLDIDDTTGRNPIFDVELIVQNYKKTEVNNLDELAISECYYANNSAQNDMSVVVDEYENKLLFTFFYKTALFKQETIDKLSNYMKNIINIVVMNDQITINEIRLTENTRIKFENEFEEEFEF
jgi:acyl carrier protein